MSSFNPFKTAGMAGWVVAAALAAAGMTFPQTAEAREVTCESSNNQYRFCRANTSGGVHLRTQMSRSACTQNSTWGYNEGGIWVSNGCRAIFKVGSERYDSGHHSQHEDNEGAAAVAALALLAAGAVAVHKSHENHHEDRHGDDHYRYQPNQNDLHYYRNSGTRHFQVTCESRNDRYQYCNAPVHNGYVRMTRRMSKSGCEFNRDWGYDRRGVWVDNGCRADFEVE